MFVEHKLNHVSLEFTNPFKENFISRKNNRKEWIIPTDGGPVKGPTMHINALPHYPGKMWEMVFYQGKICQGVQKVSNKT